LTESWAFECYVKSGWRDGHGLVLCVVRFLCTYKNADCETTLSGYKS